MAARYWCPNTKSGDQAFIDRVAELDQSLLEAGVLKPTYIEAIMRARPAGSLLCYKHLTPEFCVRSAGADVPVARR